MAWLGIDLGTSGVKVMLIDVDQQIIGSATSSSLTVERANPNWSEQDPQSWIAATEAAMADLYKAHPKAVSNVRGIGLSGQMHGATLLDKDHKVLRPCMLWNDTRSHVEAAELDANPVFRQRSGNIVFPGFTAPKVLWVKNHEPHVFEKTTAILLPKDYLRLWLTGELISEMSDAAGTSWLDVAKRDWSDELLDASGVSRSMMPGLVEGSDPSGTLRPELAAKWGMGEGVVVAGGGGDNAASAIGMGVVEAGSAFVSLGTSGVLFAANDRYLPNPESAVHAFCHAVPDTWHQMGVILSATDCLTWLSGLTGRGAGELTGNLGDTLQAPSQVTFLPYLSGERTPHNDAKAVGMFDGLTHAADANAVTRAVLEGVAFAFRDCLDALRQAGTALERATAVGGGSRSRYWLEAIATALDIEIDVPADGDFGAAFGAARLGLIASEGAPPSDICLAPKIDHTIQPNAELRHAFEDAHQRYRNLYQKNKH